MRLFLTGATGFIGSAIAADLIAAGHEVVGLTRHQQGVDRLSKAGVEPFWGILTITIVCNGARQAARE